MGFSVCRRSIGGRFRGAARWLLPLAFAVVACGGSSDDDDDDDDDGGAGGETANPTGGTTGKGGSGGTTGGTGTGGTAAAGKGGTGGTTGSAGKGGSGGNATAGRGGTGGTGNVTHVGDCEDFTPCGGEPEGTWRVEDTCVEVTLGDLPAGCENIIQGFDIDMQGTYALSGGTVTTNITTNSELTLSIDDTCARAFAMSELITAELACPLLEAEADDDDPTTTMTCDFNGTVCVCVQTQTPMAQQATDTYTVSGNQLVNSDGEATDFCVEGDTLLLQSGQAPGDGTIVGDVRVVLELSRE